MDQKQTYFGFTTAQQRKLLYEEWEQSGSVTKACRKARVSRGTFYRWKSRFEKEGYAGLEELGSRVAHRLNRKAKEIEHQVVELRKKNLDWGKLRISQEMSKANRWVNIVSPNTVRRILCEAGFWTERTGSGMGGKKLSPKPSPKR
jgi:transposase